MSKLNETQYFNNLRAYQDGKAYVNLTGLLKVRLEILKDKLLTAEDNEVYKIQGQAKEVKYLLSSLTREPMKQQHTGAFN